MDACYGCLLWLPALYFFRLGWPVTGRGCFASGGEFRGERRGAQQNLLPLTTSTKLALNSKSATGNCVVNPRQESAYHTARYANFGQGSAPALS